MPGPQNFKPRAGRTRQFYRPKCMVCQYMKNNPVFRTRVMQSTYFNPQGTESLAQVIHDFGDLFKLPTVYLHMSRHQESDLQKARKRFTPRNPELVVHPHNAGAGLPAVAGAVESAVTSQSEHEMALDEFIYEGRQKLLAKEMPITATNFLQAIKIKSDNEKSTKDRRMEMIKQFFTGGGEKKPEA